MKESLAFFVEEFYFGNSETRSSEVNSGCKRHVPRSFHERCVTNKQKHIAFEGKLVILYFG